jgi:hypothetical protein
VALCPAGRGHVGSGGRQGGRGRWCGRAGVYSDGSGQQRTCGQGLATRRGRPSCPPTSLRTVTRPVMSCTRATGSATQSVRRRRGRLRPVARMRCATLPHGDRFGRGMCMTGGPDHGPVPAEGPRRAGDDPSQASPCGGEGASPHGCGGWPVADGDRTVELASTGRPTASRATPAPCQGLLGDHLRNRSAQAAGAGDSVGATGPEDLRLAHRPPARAQAVSRGDPRLASPHGKRWSNPDRKRRGRRRMGPQASDRQVHRAGRAPAQERWGGWNGEPYTATSWRHVSVYERSHGRGQPAQGGAGSYWSAAT